MKANYLLFGILSLGCLSFAPTKVYDILFIGNAKYKVEQQVQYKTDASIFPFSMFNCQHKLGSGSYKYTTINEKSANGVTYIDPITLNEWTEYRSDKHCTYNDIVPNFVDSVVVNLSQENQDKIYLVNNSDTLYIDKLQFKLIYDSTLIIINSTAEYPWFRHLAYLQEVVKGKVEKPNIILLTSLFYTDKIGTEYFLPCSFLLKLKQTSR